ncbi:hypothetical protein BSY238_99 [Methyloversatilis sp. RAC08]|uniref:hypothetical protein n=1 Tax=Methyloversatilis sp. RAC08 TaxID=1842540 RepID=UPI00083CF8CD|nr:hypothetical protein [Methyloversatilis sp. RAC08]AOF81913.1 hypothetical protein BSY238_99 [Methyloversatilis sp. RAC08]
MNMQSGNTIQTGANGLVLADGAATLSKERTDVALQAVYQIDALSRHLVIAADMNTGSAEFPHVLRNLGARISGLSNALCGALDDDHATMESLTKQICV